MQITAITPEQEARFAEWRDKWIRIGLSTEPADFEKAEKAALRAYELCGFGHPKTIVRVGSPYAATLEAVKAYRRLQESLDGGGDSGEVKHGIAGKFSRQVLRQAGWQIDWQARMQIWMHVELQAFHQVDQQIGELVRQQVENQVEQRVGREVKSHVLWQVEHQVRRKIERRIRKGFFDEYNNNDFGGSFWCEWCSYVTYLRDVLGWRDESLERFSIEEDLVTSCGWVWWSENALVIGDRPSEIHLDAEGQLHNESGPSIAYRDGWRLHHIHGVSVPDFVIEHPDKITVTHIEKETNAEVRRVMIARMGIERFVRESDLRPVHSDDFGALYRKEIPDDEPITVVKVVNSTPEPDGSRKEYFLRVPPNISRAREAVAWTFGMGEGEYQPVAET